MYRPNLFRCVAAIWTVVACCSTTFGQTYSQGNWHPGIHIPQSHYAAPIVDYHVGQKPPLWDDQQPIERALTAVAKRSWMRFEYIHWTFARPGSDPIGAPVLNQVDPQTVFDNLNGGIAAGIGVTPTLGNIGLDDVPGVRGTWGVDLQNADFELQFFGTGQVTDGFNITDIAAGRAVGTESIGTVNRPNIVTPLLSSGAAVDATTANYLIYDDAFDVDISSQMWGAEATFLTKPYYAGQGVDWQWLGGFRYLAYEEEYNHRGVFTSGGTLATPEVSRIGGNTVNNLYGPEIGGRASIGNKWISLSATPRVAFALNDYSAETYANPITATTPTRLSDGDIDFTPIVQISFTGEIHLSPNFSVFGGYDFMWIYRLTRPHDNVVYNSLPGAAGAFTPSIEHASDLESFYTRGFSIGGVFRY